MNEQSLIQKHPLVAYFVLAYGITWSGVLLVLASVGFDTRAVGLTHAMLMFGAMVLGPSLSSLLLTSLLGGAPGWRDLGERLGRWQVGVGWYALALLTVPVLALTVLSALAALYSPALRPGFNIVGIVIGLTAGFFEELGWTGFATPRLRARYGTFAAGLLLGLLWAVWHAAADFVGNIAVMGAVWPAYFFVAWVLPLVAYRVLMTWVYSNTNSLLLAQLMHAGYTGTLLVLGPPFAVSAEGWLWPPLFAATLWVLVAVAVLVNRRARALRALEAM